MGAPNVVLASETEIGLEGGSTGTPPKPFCLGAPLRVCGPLACVFDPVGLWEPIEFRLLPSVLVVALPTVLERRIAPAVAQTAAARAGTRTRGRGRRVDSAWKE
jgi:hypothetical protein